MNNKVVVQTDMVIEGVCVWLQQDDEESDLWHTSCDKDFILTE